MNICMVVMDVDFPPDVRIEKEAKSLAEAGHKIMIVCPQFESSELTQSTWHDIDIIRIMPLPKLISKFNALIFLKTHLNLLWMTKLQQIIERFQIDVLHVHDLLPVVTSLALRNRNPHLKVVLDLHENYPFLLKEGQSDSDPWSTRLWNKIFYNINHWHKLEQACAFQSDRVIVVVDETVDRMKQLGVSQEKIVVVSNVPELDQSDADTQPITRWRDRFEDKFVLNYMGGIDFTRELDVVLRAIPTIIKSIPNVHLCIVGDGDRRSTLNQLANELKLYDYVTFTGWQPHNLAMAFVEISDVGLVPSKRSQQTDYSSPNKLFFYMLKGKPVVASNCRSIERVVLETDSGLTYKAGDEASFARVVISLKDNEIRREMGCNGYQAVIKRYNWQYEARKLVNMYKELK